MELNEFTRRFADCFSNETAPKITPATHFRMLEEWGSMMALIVIAMIDSDYAKTINSEDLTAASTVSELFEIVKSK
jgi:acyl carrier protein